MTLCAMQSGGAPVCPFTHSLSLSLSIIMHAAHPLAHAQTGGIVTKRAPLKGRTRATHCLTLHVGEGRITQGMIMYWKYLHNSSFYWYFCQTEILHIGQLSKSTSSDNLVFTCGSEAVPQV